MKPAFEQIASPPHHSFLLREFMLPVFNAPYHLHPEIELTLILSSRGKRFVGTHIADFSAGDLVLLGSNLPHCWRNDERSHDPARSIVVQFRWDFLGETLWQTPELSPVARLLERARTGLQFTGNTATQVADRMEALVGAEPVARLTGLLTVLHGLATSDEFQVLDTGYSAAAMTAADCERINRVYVYVAEHFQTAIRLDDVARLVHMTPQAFCRYFKKTTRKTFIELVNDYRIRYASQLLTDNRDKAVAEVCFESGFGNVSHFNNRFRLTTGQSPLQYRRAFEQV
ncbi:MAG: AraC family transcriptional regulator [Sphingobacteriaceae bacterium]|nr:AraC family transcriptional regulator [Cytophagaceae bacterium]